MTDQEKAWFERGFAAYADNVPRHQLYLLTPQTDTMNALKWMDRGWTANREDHEVADRIEAQRRAGLHT